MGGRVLTMDNVLRFYMPDIVAHHARTREGKLQVHEYRSPVSQKCGPSSNGRAGVGGGIEGPQEDPAQGGG